VSHPDSFIYHGTELPYCRDAYNDAAKNERAIEVPIARRFITDHAGTGLEVGNVLSHYGPVGWPVVDLHEGPIKCDLFDYHTPCDWIVSISTLEHVRWDALGGGEVEEGGSVKGIAHLRSLLRQGGRMLVTVPFGVNRPLDEAIIMGDIETVRCCTFLRDGSGGWRQSVRPDAWRAYGPHWANAVWIAEMAG